MDDIIDMFINFTKPSKLEINKKYYFFRDNILPIKENEDNISGQIVYFFKPHGDQVDFIWRDIILAFV